MGAIPSPWVRPPLHQRGWELKEMSFLIGGDPLTQACPVNTTLDLSFQFESLNFYRSYNARWHLDGVHVE